MIRRIFKFIRKEVFYMAVIYATLIVKGKKTINDVPATLVEQVKDCVKEKTGFVLEMEVRQLP